MIANGAGKSTFLRILSGELDSTSGEVSIEPNRRMAVLKQNHYEFDEYQVIETVIMGHKRLYEVMKEKKLFIIKKNLQRRWNKSRRVRGIYDLNGWEAEAEASRLLNNLGIDVSLFDKK